MYQDNSPNIPALGGGYVPYFYQAGLHQLCPLPSSNVPQASLDSGRSVRDSPTGFPILGPADRIQTVEQVVANGYFSAPRGDPVTVIIADRMSTSWLGLDDLSSQIRERREMYQRNVYEIELAKCAAMNSLYAHEAYHGPPTDKQFYSRHKRLQLLYEQQRQERTDLWKDVSRLRLALPESAQQYLAAYRKVSLLKDKAGDAP